MPPNILWLVLSQWRADQVGAAGHPQVRTPAFDRLCVEGVRATGAVANHPFPTQSKASLLTGLLAPRAGVSGWFDPLPASTRTIAHHLARAGYATAHFGKWQLGRRDPTAPLVGEAHARTLVAEEHRGGFETWWGWDGGFLIDDPWVHGTGEAGPRRLRGHQARVVPERLIEFLRSVQRPFFACLHLDPPHPPYGGGADGQPTPDPAAVAIPADVPREPVLEERVRREFAGSLAQLAAADAGCGRVLSALDDLGLADNTLVVMTANHGDQHGSEGLLRKGWPNAGSVRVPLALRFPGRVRAGSELGGIVGLADLFPTCAALAGLSVPPGLDGRDLSGAVLGKTAAPTSAPLSLPQSPGIAHQCPFAWHGEATEQGIAWSAEPPATGGGSAAWALPGWR